MIIYVDIDNTIANTFKVGKTFDYTKHTPRYEQIQKINKLFSKKYFFILILMAKIYSVIILNMIILI